MSICRQNQQSQRKMQQSTRKSGQKVYIGHFFFIFIENTELKKLETSSVQKIKKK